MSRPDWQPIEGVPGCYESLGSGPGGWPLRSVAFELADGELCVHSPLASRESAEAVRSIGTPAVLLMPNRYHHLGVPIWCDAYPKVICVGSAAVRKRFESKIAVRPLDELRARLKSTMSVIEPAGLKNGETWVVHRNGSDVTFFVTDAFFNVASVPAGIVGWFLRASGTGPGLSVGKTWKWLAVSDGKAYVEWTQATIASEQPTRLVMSHGHVVTGATLGPALADLIVQRMGRA